ncbi:MAG: ATP-dependent DNA ligase [Candidatus Woesearchaeota archaeon]|nr:ATP-dependent DNA ligase [Candidatus Woesearchaeota archaeon]MDP7181068.1 ATP-dependent DNA ligase [Candidatus Woesearchaeota archaeon]MDP7198311.1 ATP-dependent DNA ligase [Candidatus Woesearchaeota archaeon]MDP7467413.1 ATP-dependent DNA ligase [Candidatus Woesearchaeota archaeon]MDP7647640.1 ATP-dependent DNA ligase [Candidatus Woesearchaeota archaeon]
MRYQTLAEAYEQLESVSSRLEKTKQLADFLQKVDDLPRVLLLLQGRVFMPGDEREIGVASQLAVKAIVVASGRTKTQVETSWKKTGDLGKAAAEVLQKKSQATLVSSHLTVQKVFDTLQKLASMEGQGTVDRKVKFIAELLSQASPVEARYVIRTVLQDLRAGVGNSTLRDALVWAYVLDPKYDGKKIDVDREKYNEVVEQVQAALDVSNDFGSVAELLKKQGLKGLEKTKMTVGTPLKVMLYQKSKGVADAFKTVGKPAAVEYKYDGFRMQIHKKKDVQIFTRRMENVTRQFPDVVKLVQDNVKAKECILDAEAVGLTKDGKYLPFQQMSQRIKRKYDIEKTAKELPVCVCVFDILEKDGEPLVQTPFQERHKIIEQTINVTTYIKPAEQLITDDEKEATAFYEKSLKAGNEGVMMKRLDSVYKPGSRVGFGVKVKPVMETLDCVIVGAEWGEGKRSKWLASFTLAIKDGDEFLEIGKMGTGIKEKPEEGLSFGEMTEMLKPLVIEEKGKGVKTKPKIVVEINYEEIQKSPTYASGYALRFPRLVRLREDRGPNDVADLKEVENLYKGQRGR